MKIHYTNQTDYKIDLGWLKRAEDVFLVSFPQTKEIEISVVLVDEQRITTLNEEYRKEEGPTDVLSFNYQELSKSSEVGDNENGSFLGEIVIAPAILKKKQEGDLNVDPVEFYQVLTHGFLHLLGYEHEDVAESEKIEMERIEKEVLIQLLD